MELKNKFYKNLHIFVLRLYNRCSEIGRPVYLALKGKLQAGHWIINSLEHVLKYDIAGVVKLVDTLDLGSSASRRGVRVLHPHLKPLWLLL